ncbi:MAG: PIN/TRAM domain-containing protein [Planctomycetes bacterium]|nr:PIN/TRAM domain-containing protein [Planctomycetota bacterium]
MLHIVRALFVGICGVLGGAIGDQVYKHPLGGLLCGLGAGLCFILLELAFTRRVASVLSTLMIGLLVGCLVSYFINMTLDLVLRDSDPVLKQYRNISITVVLSFLSILVILHMKDDFKFVIPFVELKRESGGSKPVILDTSAIIDGRIADVIDTKVIDTQVIVPRFVLIELQQVADSQDKLKRNRGRRGLDILNRLRKSKGVEVHEVELPDIQGVDSKLVKLAKTLDARIVTTDFNLNKVAQVQGVEVVNVNDLASALRPVVLQGEKLTIKVIRTGESAGQGVGYLDDGTMVVAEECANRIGQDVELTITNVLQTSAGRLIFGRPNQA